MFVEIYLKNYVQAHPGRSMYGFSIDSDRPGYLKLCFLNKSTKDGGVIQTWVSRSFDCFMLSSLGSRSKFSPELTSSTRQKCPVLRSCAMPSRRSTRTSSHGKAREARPRVSELAGHQWAVGHQVEGGRQHRVCRAWVPLVCAVRRRTDKGGHRWEAWGQR